MSPIISTLSISSSDLWKVRSLMLGTVMESIAYGVVLALSFGCLYQLWRSPSGVGVQWRRVIYIFGIFFVATAGMGLQARWNQMIFIDHHPYPGGPVAFAAQQDGNAINVANMAMLVVMNWFVSIETLYRFYCIHYHRPRWIRLLPGVFFLGLVAMALVVLAQISKSDSSIAPSYLSIVYLSMSAALDTILTAFLVHRLLRCSIGNGLFNFWRTNLYRSVARILVECASLFTAAALMSIVTISVHSPLANIFLPFLRQIQAVYPLLVTLQVAMNRTRQTSWDEDYHTKSLLMDCLHESRTPDGTRSSRADSPIVFTNEKRNSADFLGCGLAVDVKLTCPEPTYDWASNTYSSSISEKAGGMHFEDVPSYFRRSLEEDNETSYSPASTRAPAFSYSSTHCNSPSVQEGWLLCDYKRGLMANAMAENAMTQV